MNAKQPAADSREPCGADGSQLLAEALPIAAQPLHWVRYDYFIGQLVIEGSAATTVRFRHADGSEYGRVVEPLALEARAKTFSALRGRRGRLPSDRNCLSFRVGE